MDKLLSKAKIGLMIHGSVFLSTITFSVKHVFTEDVPTAATEGLTIWYNPTWFKTLNDQERIFLLAHETWHIALMHPTRMIGKKKDVYRRACDYVINGILSKAGYKAIHDKPPITDVLYDIKYNNWSTAEVYEDLLLNDPDTPKDYISDLLEQPVGSTGKPDLNNKTKGKQLSPQDIENKIKTILVKASTQSKMGGKKAGSIPGEIERRIDELINPKLNYDELLHRYMDSHVKDDYSWSKRNRRYPDIYMPSQHSEAIGSLTFAIDTSGSISREDTQKILSEINHIIEKYKPQQVTILDCDRKIHNIHVIDDTNNVDILDLKFSGGGGTSFVEPIKYCEEHDTNLLIYFTDLYATPITKDPSFPVVWLCYSQHEPSPVGTTIYYDPNS